MSDKSPRQHLAAKTSKSIKEKRADKRARGESDASATVATPPAKGKKRS